jgi:hypothetical protein
MKIIYTAWWALVASVGASKLRGNIPGETLAWSATTSLDNVRLGINVSFIRTRRTWPR